MLKIAFAPIYKYALPEGHRFPMEKYELLPEQLLYEGTVSEDNFFAPGPLEEPYILLTHQRAYWEKLKNQQLTIKEAREIGFPMSRRLVERGTYIAQGTIQASDFALRYGIGMNIAGGTHHSFSHKGAGFCLLNDIAIACNYLIFHRKVRKILVIDLDVHQGNGTAEIFRNEPLVFTFSMHGANNYPVKKEFSDLDIPLPNNTPDKTYLTILRETLPQLLDEVQPDFVFYLAGVDVLHTDQLGKLALTTSGCKERDRLVLNYCKRNEIPLTVVMGGGYSRKLTHIIDAHANTFRLAQEIFF